MSLELYIAYIAACLIVTIVPGPTVALVLANSLNHGTRAGLLNVVGTQLGLVVMMGIVLVGLVSIVATMGIWFDLARHAVALYLIWLGWKLCWQSSGDTGSTTASPPRGGFVLQGFLVIVSNPKALLLFGAFIPQFVDPTGDYVSQILLLGATLMVVGGLSDGLYAVFSGRMHGLVSRRYTRLISRISGGFLIGGGIWLALARTR
jgi:homoserine/homoserine lactone efflux protein